MNEGGRARQGRRLRALVASLALSACSSAEVTKLSDAYEGEPFPNRRQTFQLPRGDFGLTSNNGSDDLSVLDLEHTSVLGSAPVGRDPVDNDGPHHLALAADLGVVFTVLAYPPPAAAPGPHAAHGSSQRPGYLMALALGDLAPLGELRVETNPGDVVLSADESTLVVSHFDLTRAQRETELSKQRADLAVVDARALAAGGIPAPRFIRTCVAPHGVALSTGKAPLAYVACYGEDAIAVVDLSENEPVPELISLGPGGAPGAPLFGPYAIVLSPDGSRAAVSNTESSDVRFFDTEARAFEKLVIGTPGAPYFSAWSSDGSVLFIPTQNPDALLAIDAQSGQAVRARDLDPSECQRPHEAVFGSSFDTLYLVCEGDHRSPSHVLVLDPETLETRTTLDVGVYPDRMAIGRGAR